MIKSIDQLKVKLLKMSKTEQLDRHAHVEVALVGQINENKKLKEALSRKEAECAGYRFDMKNIVAEHG